MSLTHNSLRRAREAALDQVVTCWDAFGLAGLRRAWKAMNSCVVHEQPDQAFTDRDAVALKELGTDAPRAVCSAGLSMHLPDHRSEPLAAHRHCGHRATPIPVVALSRHAEDAAADLDGVPGVDESVDHGWILLGAGPDCPASRCLVSESQPRLRAHGSCAWPCVVLGTLYGRLPRFYLGRSGPV